MSAPTSLNDLVNFIDEQNADIQNARAVLDIVLDENFMKIITPESIEATCLVSNADRTGSALRVVSEMLFKVSPALYEATAALMDIVKSLEQIK